MSETRTLLTKISALRQRLEQAQGLANEARSAATRCSPASATSRPTRVPFEAALRAAADRTRRWTWPSAAWPARRRRRRSRAGLTARARRGAGTGPRTARPPARAGGHCSRCRASPAATLGVALPRHGRDDRHVAPHGRPDARLADGPDAALPRPGGQPRRGRGPAADAHGREPTPRPRAGADRPPRGPAGRHRRRPGRRSDAAAAAGGRDPRRGPRVPAAALPRRRPRRRAATSSPATA